MDLANLLNLSITSKASDLHLSPGLPPILRIDGNLKPIENTPILDSDTTRSLIHSVMNRKQQLILDRDRQLDFTAFLSANAGFRVNAYYQINGLAAAFRIIPSHIPTLSELRAPAIIQQLLTLSSGLILITGSTGCGKSSTLAAMIEYINIHAANHIITIEDPIEYIHQSKRSLVTQRQIHRDATNFKSALRAALREDPDILLVGEMRDLETIRLALTAAETGHLVMATLHASSAPHAIHRIIDVFSAAEKHIIRNQLSESLQAVFCQTLLNRIDGGRVAAFEVMLGTLAIRNLIREDEIAHMHSVMQTNKNLGMCTMEQAIQELISNNLISFDAGHSSRFQRTFFD